VSGYILGTPMVRVRRGRAIGDEGHARAIADVSTNIRRRRIFALFGAVLLDGMYRYDDDIEGKSATISTQLSKSVGLEIWTEDRNTLS